MDVNDTVHTVRLQFDLKMQSQSEKIASCERALSSTPQSFCWNSHLFMVRRLVISTIQYS